MTEDDDIDVIDRVMKKILDNKDEVGKILDKNKKYCERCIRKRLKRSYYLKEDCYRCKKINDKK